MTQDRQHIAIGVDRGGQVWAGHFGVAPVYHIYDQRGVLLMMRSNPHARDGRKHHGDPGLIAALLPECAVFIAHSMGKRQKLDALGIQAYITAEQDPQVALTAYLADAS